MRSHALQRRQVAHAFVVEGQQARATTSFYFKIPFCDLMGVEIVLYHRQLDLAGSADRGTDLFDLFVPTLTTVDGIVETTDHQQAQLQPRRA